jgi:hypothetical protein
MSPSWQSAEAQKNSATRPALSRVQAFHLVAVDGVLHAPLPLSAFSLGNDLRVGHGSSFRYFVLPARGFAFSGTETCVLSVLR